MLGSSVTVSYNKLIKCTCTFCPLSLYNRLAFHFGPRLRLHRTHLVKKIRKRDAREEQRGDGAAVHVEELLGNFSAAVPFFDIFVLLHVHPLAAHVSPGGGGGTPVGQRRSTEKCSVQDEE